MKTEWVKPGTGATVGELRRWAGHDVQLGDRRRTALAIVRVGPPEPYDVERLEAAIEQVVDTCTRLDAALTAMDTFRLRSVVVDEAHKRYAEANAETDMAVALLRWKTETGAADAGEARAVYQHAAANERDAAARWRRLL